MYVTRHSVAGQIDPTLPLVGLRRKINIFYRQTKSVKEIRGENIYKKCLLFLNPQFKKVPETWFRVRKVFTLYWRVD